MKKLLYSALALAGIFAVSCNKEREVPPVADNTLTGQTHTVVLKASFDGDNLTRTSYADNKTFSWVEGDVVRVRCLNEETEYWYWADFVAQSGGATTDLVGEVEDGYEPYDVAVYVPGANYVGSVSYNGSSVRVVVPISYHLDGFGLGTDAEDGDTTPYWNSVSVPSGDPLSVLPLVSVVKDGVLSFQTGVGVLNVNLTDVPSEATHIRVSTSGKYLGNYLMVKDAQISNENPWVLQEEGKDDVTYAVRFSEYYFQPASDGNASLLFPLPVGTLPAGSVLEVLDAEDNVLFSQSTSKDIVVERNKITKLAALKAKIEWETVGTGQFGDHYYFNANYDQEVEIQRNSANPNEFRIVKPYESYIQLLKDEDAYEESDALYGPSEYLNFRILKKGEVVNGVTITHDDLVWFDAFYTGLLNSSYGVDPFFAHPSRWGSEFPESQWLRSIVVKYQADGKTPANIQLAPVAFWVTDPDAGRGYWTGGTYLGYNNLFEIRFPGAESIDLDASVSYSEIVDSDPAQAVALVVFEHSEVISGAKIVIAANETDAAAALSDASRYTEAAGAGEYEVKLPANAPSGDYYVYAQTTVSSDLTPVAAQLLVSSSFKYFNANTDLGYTLDDIAGTYSVNNYHYNRQAGDWIQDTMSFTVEESDDPLNGDIMFVNFLQEALGYYSGLTYTSNLYAYFNTATGEITIPGGQTIATAGGADWYVAGFGSGTSDVNMLLVSPGSIQIDGNACFYTVLNGTEYRWMWTNANLTFTRTGSSSAAPAFAPVGNRGGRSVCPPVPYKAVEQSVVAPATCAIAK